MELKKIYGSFFISDIEFAIPALKVQEVVVAPTSYIRLPLSPDYLLGLFNLRGAVIPIVDLKKLLKVDDTSEVTEKRIAIVEYSNFRVGIVFTKTGEIFKGLDAECTDFDQNYHQGLISGLFKKENGKRVIQILNLEAVFKLQHITLVNSKIENVKSQVVASRGLKKQTITFKLENINYAIDIKGIQEILKIDSIPSVLKFHESSLGSINLRGTTIPIIDFAHFLGQREISETKSFVETSKRVIVLKIQNERIGLLVDCVDSLLSFYEDQVKTFPSISGRLGDLFQGCITSFSDEEILFVNHLNIFNDKDLSTLTGGKSRLSMNNAQEGHEEAKKDPIRSYISFVLQNQYVVRMDSVKEIIEIPKNLLSPPNLPKSVKGILNLRGHIICILDPYGLLEKKSQSNSKQEKILILKNTDKTFGIIVQSVESILKIPDSCKMAIPSVIKLKQSSKDNFISINEIINFADSNQNKQEFLLFELENFKSLDELQTA